jgi:regulator of RNase E activity RraA
MDREPDDFAYSFACRYGMRSSRSEAILYEMTALTLLARLESVDCAAVSDALDALGLPAGVGGIRPVWGPAAIVGFAVTVALGPRGEGPAGAHIATTAIEAAGHDSVIVVDNQGRRDVSCWGGILSLGAALRGVRGVIADGVCRDVAEARDLGFPVFACGTIPATARGRLEQRSTGDPVNVAGLTVCNGDIVMADETGVVAIPRDRGEEVAALAEAIVARERAIADDLRSGASLSHVMHDARLAGQQEQPHDTP